MHDVRPDPAVRIHAFLRSAKAAILRSAISLSSQSSFLSRLAHRVFRSQETRLIHLRRLGFEPATVFDIGAFHGHWTAAASHIFRSAKFICFEANDDNRPFLALAEHPFAIAALSATEEYKTFYKPRSGIATGASRSTMSAPR